MSETDTDTLDAETEELEGEEALGQDTLDLEGGEGEEAGLIDESPLDTDPVDTSLDMGDVGGNDLLQQYGLDKYKSVEDALKGFSEAQSLIGQRDQYAEFGRQIAPHYQQFQAWLQQNQQQEPEPFWNPPHKWDEEMQRLSTLAMAGGEAWDNMRPEDRRRVEEYTNYKNNWWQRVFNEPQTFASQVVGPYIEQKIGQAFQQRDLNYRAQEFAERNRDLIQDREAYAELDGLLAEFVPERYAEELVRLRRKVGSVESKEQDLDSKKKELRARNRIRGKTGGKPTLTINPEKDTYDQIQRKVLAAEAAGVLPD